MSLADLAASVRLGKIRAEELVRRAAARIEANDRRLGAVVALRIDEALMEARGMDARIAEGEDPGPLCGLPMLVKDNENVTGMVTTFGSLPRAEDPPAAVDAGSVSRLRAAGAIVVGKTNVPEYAFEGFTTNRLFGDTRNPWAPDWTPGGSSGGSGAALAAGLVPIATATDGGGSVRIPAAFCGLAGLKPTNGLIARSPIPSWMDLSTKGPLAGSIADVRLLLDILKGPEPGDPTAIRSWRARAGALKPSKILATPRMVGSEPIDPGVQEAFDVALKKLETAVGLSIEPIEPGSIFSGGDPDEDWITMVLAEELTWLSRERVIGELETGVYSDYFADAMRAALEIGLDDYVAARRRRFEYVKQMDLLLGEDGVLVCPTMTVQGFTADGRMIGRTEQGTASDAYNCQAANVTGHPALSVPAGLCPNGIPFGLQITAPRESDDLVLSLGEIWEAEEPWPAVAPGFEPFQPG
jgi:Asp-tRNA(Asn)/Glu-tRNA(Gln) amidotransferase A subunit family amidase